MTNCILFAALLTYLTCVACKAVPRDTSEKLKLTTNISDVGSTHSRKEVNSSSFSIYFWKHYEIYVQHVIYDGSWFHLAISMRSSMLWITYWNCSSIACYGRVREWRIPPTFVPLNATFESIDPLANATGILGSDKIEVGAHDEGFFVVPRATFGLALDLQTTELNDLYSGVLGLGLNNVGTNSKPFIRSIIDQGIIGAKFSIWLEPKHYRDGFITYGSSTNAQCGALLDDGHPFCGSSYVFQIHSLNMFDYIWALFKAEIDLDEVLSMPPAIAGMIARRVGAQFDPGSNRYWVDCNARFPNLMLDAEWDYKKKTIPAAQLILNDLMPGNLCVLAVVGRDQPSFGPTLTLGVPFLRSYCAIFNIGEMRMEFAKNLDNRSMIVTSKESTTVSSETATSTTRPATFSSKPVTSVYPPITLSTEATATDANICKMFIISSLCALLSNSF